MMQQALLTHMLSFTAEAGVYGTTAERKIKYSYLYLPTIIQPEHQKLMKINSAGGKLQECGTCLDTSRASHEVWVCMCGVCGVMACYSALACLQSSSSSPCMCVCCECVCVKGGCNWSVSFPLIIKMHQNWCRYVAHMADVFLIIVLMTSKKEHIWSHYANSRHFAWRSVYIHRAPIAFGPLAFCLNMLSTRPFRVAEKS